MSNPFRTILNRTTVAAVAAAILPTGLSAQSTRAFTTCSQAAMEDCAFVQLTSRLGAGPGGLNLFQIAVTNLGSGSEPSLATSAYFMILATGQSAAPVDAQFDTQASPAPMNGATVSDPTAWDLYDSGDAIFLSSETNLGIGGCVAGVAVATFGQMGQTCGATQALLFSFITPRTYDPSAFTVSDMEWVGLSPNLPADSCGGSTPCSIAEQPPITPTPEPSAFVLAVSGSVSIAGVGWRRRRRLNG